MTQIATLCEELKKVRQEARSLQESAIQTQQALRDLHTKQKDLLTYMKNTCSEYGPQAVAFHNHIIEVLYK